MSRKLCEHCWGSGQCSRLENCESCGGTGQNRAGNSRPAVDPILLAKVLMAEALCNCDLIQADNSKCADHKFEVMEGL